MNVKKPGSERRSGRGFQVKTEAGLWRWKHYLIWEAANGPIPEGFILKFVDGDRKNLSLDNLRLVTRKEIGQAVGKKKPSPIGKETVWNNYVFVKVAKPDVWRAKHLLIWEAAHGPVPDGHLVMFADGDPRNFCLDNLILVSRSMHASRLHKHVAHPVGTEYVTPEGFTLIKVSEKPNVWRQKHRLIWEAVHGRVPEGSTVWFADGNKSNFRLDNLVLISLREQGYLLYTFKGVADLAKAGCLKPAASLAKLALAVNDKRRKLDKVISNRGQP